MGRRATVYVSWLIGGRGLSKIGSPSLTCLGTFKDVAFLVPPTQYQ